MARSKNPISSRARNKPLSGPDKARPLIASLGNRDQSARGKARASIVAMGESAVPSLVEALSSENSRIRWEVVRLLDEINVAWSKHADSRTIKALIADFSSKDGLVRVRARRALAAIGSPAVPLLEEALTSKDTGKRWEAAKALGQIGDPEAIGALIRALTDQNFDVRWLAAEALLAIGRDAMAPLLRELLERSDSRWLREGTHHVLHDIDKEDIRVATKPVLRALEDDEALLGVPLAAETALKALEKTVR